MDFDFAKYNRGIDKIKIGSKEDKRLNSNPQYTGLFGDYNRRIDENKIGTDAWKWCQEDSASLKFTPLDRSSYMYKSPLGGKCKRCNGTGEINTGKLFGAWVKDCPDCNGSGESY